MQRGPSAPRRCEGSTPRRWWDPAPPAEPRWPPPERRTRRPGTRGRNRCRGLGRCAVPLSWVASTPPDQRGARQTGRSSGAWPIPGPERRLPVLRSKPRPQGSRRRLMTFRKRLPPVGARVGTLMIPEGSPPPKIHVFDYGPGTCREAEIEDPEELIPYVESDECTWVDVQGFGDEAKLRRIAEIFDLHPLTLEDATNVPQRARNEVFPLASADHRPGAAENGGREDRGAPGLHDPRQAVRAHVPGSLLRLLRPGARTHPPGRGAADPEAGPVLSRVRADRHADRPLLPGGRAARDLARGDRGGDQ